MLKITQIEKTLENMVAVANDSDVIFLRYAPRVKHTGRRHHKPPAGEEKYMVGLHYKMLDSMKISDMKEWMDDPATAIIKFEIIEE